LCRYNEEYFHVFRDGVDLVFVSHPCFYEAGLLHKLNHVGPSMFM
jgi:hypothetical protein